LIETPFDQSFGETWKHLVSYNRTRTCFPGDQLLFRPVLFSLIAIEFSLLGRDPLLWQFFGICLYSISILLSYFLIRKFCPRSMAFCLAAALSTHMSFIDAASWSHIHGYLLFSILLLFAFHLLIQKRFNRGWNRLLFFGIALLASLTYEVGTVAFGAWGLVQCLKNTKPLSSRPWEVALIPIIYAALSVLDWHIQRPLQSIHLASEFSLRSLFDTLSVWAQVWSQIHGWILIPIFELNFQELQLRLEVGGPRIWIGGISLIVLIAAGGFQFRKIQSRGHFDVFFVSFVAAAFFAFMIAFGRVRTRGLEYMAMNTYYSYQYTLAALPALIILSQNLWSRRLVRKISMLGLILFSVANANHARSNVFALADLQTKMFTFQRQLSIFLTSSTTPESVLKSGLHFCERPFRTHGLDYQFDDLRLDANQGLNWTMVMYGRRKFDFPTPAMYCATAGLPEIRICDSCDPQDVQKCCENQP